MNMSFQLVPKSVTLNDLERRNGHYFALFRRIIYINFQRQKCIPMHLVMAAL